MSFNHNGRNTPALLFMALGTILVAGCSDNNQGQNLNMTTLEQNKQLTSGHLAPCRNRPNCVSSESVQDSFHVPPLEISGPASKAWQALQDIILDMGGRIEKVDEHFLHATFRSRVFSFVDDVTCRLDRDKNLVHIRSAARVGYFDFGVNRKRVEKVRKRLTGRIHNMQL